MAPSQVEGNTESLLEKGSLVAYGVTFPNTGASMMALEINETRWWLRPDMATLKAGLCTYMLDVSQPDAATPTFFCVTFADDTLPEVGCRSWFTASAANASVVSCCKHALRMLCSRQIM